MRNINETGSTAEVRIFLYNNQTYRVVSQSPKFLLAIDKVNCQLGDEITMYEIYNSTKGGFVKKEPVKAVCVLDKALGKKVTSYKYAARIGWKVEIGHRTQFTVVEVGGN